MGTLPRTKSWCPGMRPWPSGRRSLSRAMPPRPRTRPKKPSSRSTGSSTGSGPARRSGLGFLAWSPTRRGTAAGRRAGAWASRCGRRSTDRGVLSLRRRPEDWTREGNPSSGRYALFPPLTPSYRLFLALPFFSASLCWVPLGAGWSGDAVSSSGFTRRPSSGWAASAASGTSASAPGLGALR